jgi:hypothetical protein
MEVPWLWDGEVPIKAMEGKEGKAKEGRDLGRDHLPERSNE